MESIKLLGRIIIWALWGWWHSPAPRFSPEEVMTLAERHDSLRGKLTPGVGGRAMAVPSIVIPKYPGQTVANYFSMIRFLKAPFRAKRRMRQDEKGRRALERGLGSVGALSFDHRGQVRVQNV